jgi:DnaK suppressor protein
MEEDQLEAFRVALLSQRDEIEKLSSAGQDATGTVTLDQSKVGRVSRMDALQAQQMAQETARRRQTQLQKIDSALRRIDAGNYGDCFVCGEAINTARLEIDPACTRCTDCMEK